MMQNIFAVIIAVAVSTLAIFLFVKTRALAKKRDMLERQLDSQYIFWDADDNQVYLKDKNLRYLFVNKAFCEAAGKSKGDILGRDDYAISEQEVAQKRRITDFEVLTKKTMVHDKIEWKNQIFKITKFPVNLPDGSTGVGAFVRNITEESNNKKILKKTIYRNKILLDIVNRPYENKRDALDYVLHEALKLTESQFGYIYLYDELKQEFILNSWSRDVMEKCAIQNPRTTYKLQETGLWGEAVRQRRPIIINDMSVPNLLKKGCPIGHVELLKFMTVPVMMDKQIVAVVGLANKQDDYDDSDVLHLSMLMSGVWNIMKRKEAQEKLAYERNEYFQTLVSIGDGVLVADKNGRIEMLNTAAQRLTGWPLEEALGKPYAEVFALLNEDEGDKVGDPIRDAFITDAVQSRGGTATLLARDGRKYYVEENASPIRDEYGHTIGVVLVFRDVSDKNEHRKEMEYLSFHDALTGLYNRRFFEEAMLHLDTEDNIPISIIMGDVNGLKLTNDVFGHAYGDILLKKISDILQKVCREDDIIARLGGDEFVILLPRTGREEARSMMKNIKSRFEKEQVKAIRGSISMGTDTKLTDTDHLMQVMENAEEKMYLTKTLERKSVKSAAINEIVQALHESSEMEKMHALRVSSLCYDFGRTLGMPDVELRKLKDAGFLHDIGKIAVDTHILNNPNAPSSQEWGTIKRHPIIGYRILNAFDETLDLADPVLTHHERWDGKGYPKGLKGDEIPLIARIIALTESYDKMVYASDKSRGAAHLAAMEAIGKNAGTQFDPSLAEAFIRFIKEPRSLDADSLMLLDIRF